MRYSAVYSVYKYTTAIPELGHSPSSRREASGRLRGSSEPPEPPRGEPGLRLEDAAHVALIGEPEMAAVCPCQGHGVYSRDGGQVECSTPAGFTTTLSGPATSSVRPTRSSRDPSNTSVTEVRGCECLGCSVSGAYEISEM